MNSPIASKSSGIFKASCRTDWSSTGKLVATEEDQEHLNFHEKNRYVQENLSIQDIQELKETQETRKAEGNDEDWPQYLHISPNYVMNMEKVFSIARQRNGRNPSGQVKDLDVNTAIWCIFMSVTLQAAGHLGIDYTENPRSTKNHPKKFETVISSD